MRSVLPRYLHDPHHLSDASAALLDDAPAEEDAVPEGTPAEQCVCIIIHEGMPTSDYRFFEENCFTWRELPLEFTNGHYGPTIGRIDAIGRMTDDPSGTLTVDNFEETVGTSGPWVVGLITFDLANEDGLTAAKRVQGQFLRGVSLEWGGDENGEAEVVWECNAQDEYGFCEDYTMRVIHAEILRVALEGAQAMAESVIIDTSPRMAEDTVVAGAGPVEAPPRARAQSARRASVWSPPTRPDREWFEIAEPEPGGMIELPTGGSLAADEFLIQQDEEGHLAVPIQILPSGLLFGHGAYWGQCHIGYQDVCTSPPSSECGYAHFHTGATPCSDGSQVATGVLTMGCDHAATGIGARLAVDHYANMGLAWADVRVVDGLYGPWLCGAVRPDITEAQWRALSASSLSGDWRRLGGHLEAVAWLSVNTPGFPIVREAITASGGHLSSPMPSARFKGEELQALTASAIVRRNASGCGCGNAGHRGLERRVQRVEAVVAALGLEGQALESVVASMA